MNHPNEQGKGFNKKLITNLWILGIVISFGLVYARSLAFVYTDGDDATSIAYHLLGRNKDIQPAYKAYQGMMDKILSFLPAQETVLRTAGMGITSLAAVCMMLLIMMLIFDWNKEIKHTYYKSILITLSLLLAVPELFYFGLTYSPTLVAMCLVLFAHLILRRGLPKTLTGSYSLIVYALSLAIFSFGVSFRWNIGAYVMVIIADLWTTHKPESKSYLRQFLPGLAWGVGATILSLGMIAISGYGFADVMDQVNTILRVINQAGTAASTSAMDALQRNMLTLSSEATPSFVLFSILGFIHLVRTRNSLWIVVLIGLLGVSPWLKAGDPKFLIVSLPGLMLCFSNGFTSLINYLQPNRYRLIFYILVGIILIGPWLIGIHATREGTAWGPSFEIRPYYYAESKGLKLNLVFGSGAAFPTPEGPRPLYGHAFVLLGGGWKAFVVDRANERQETLNEALSLGVPLVITNWSPDYYLDELYLMGFRTQDPANRTATDSYFTERRFSNPDGRTITLLFHEVEGTDIFNLIQHIHQNNNNDLQVVLQGYSQTLRTIYDKMPQTLTPISTTSATLNLKPLTTIEPKPINSYITNPGIGWQWDQDVVGSAHLPESVAYSDRLKIGWETLNPADGVFDWSALDAQISTATAQGKQFSFRIFTMAGGDYGGSLVPDWVTNKGAVITPSGEPDYSNCTYQQEWGNFVNAMLQRYDGDPDIAFIDISGYGEFNEWNWGDQTEWDTLWDENYKKQMAGPSTMQTLDGQARRRLADMFIGGSFVNHQCRDRDGNIQAVSYTYTGAHHTQLVMPFAGIVQSTQYVFSRRTDVGFRYDCLGRDSSSLSGQVGQVWRSAPVVFEFCSPDQFNFATAQHILYLTHGSLVHNNGNGLSAQDLQELMANVGYKYYLKEAQVTNPISKGSPILLSMLWQNTGTAPVYSKMGQNFELHVYLLDHTTNNLLADYPADSDISRWMPPNQPTDAPPENPVHLKLNLPESLKPGRYTLKVSIINQRTGLPIQLAFEGEDTKGMYFLADIEVTAQ